MVAWKVTREARKKFTVLIFTYGQTEKSAKHLKGNRGRAGPLQLSNHTDTRKEKDKAQNAIHHKRTHSISFVDVEYRCVDQAGYPEHSEYGPENTFEFHHRKVDIFCRLNHGSSSAREATIILTAHSLQF